MLRYLALSVAPVSVVSPIQRLSLIFRMLFGWIMNREHEIFSWRLVVGTCISLVGAILLALSLESVVNWSVLPDWVRAAAAWSTAR